MATIVYLMTYIFLLSLFIGLTAQLSEQEQEEQDIDKKTSLHVLRHSMSCYVCSTMDYENPSDNLCRFMKQNRLKPPQSNHHAAPTSMINYATPTTSTATTSETTSTSTSTTPSSNANSMITSPDSINEPFSTMAQDRFKFLDQSSAGLHNNMSHGQEPQSSELVNYHRLNESNNQTSLSTLTTQIPQYHNQQQASLVQQNYQAQLRAPPPANFIRHRSCLEEENFCSIVSVVRIEFVNETLVSRFWAMERNCSKSCNTGCMLIGERVRLRVCSQCCRTPNCNIGSGASGRTSWKTFTLNIEDTIIMILLLLAAHFV